MLASTTLRYYRARGRRIVTLPSPARLFCTGAAAANAGGKTPRRMYVARICILAAPVAGNQNFWRLYRSSKRASYITFWVRLYHAANSVAWRAAPSARCAAS